MQALVRLDTNGAIVQDVPVADAFDLFEMIRTDGGAFLYGYFSEPGNPNVCGLRAVDLATLAVGPSIQLPTDGGCGGNAAIDDANAASVILPDVSDPLIFRVDTSTGTVTPVPLDGAVPPEYRVDELFSLAGTTYATMRPDIDLATGAEVTAPDGSPLPILSP